MPNQKKVKNTKLPEKQKTDLEQLEAELDLRIQSLINEIKSENESLKSLRDVLNNDEVVFHTNWESFLKAGRNESP